MAEGAPGDATSLASEPTGDDLAEFGGGGLSSAVGLVLALSLLFIALGWYVTDLSGGAVASVGSGVSAGRGESVFWGTGPVDGTCHTCHSIGDRGNMMRGPNLGESDFGPPIGARAVQRAATRTEQTGEEYTATDYLVECLADPPAYVVEGFPTHLMPLTFTGQIALSLDDIMSVVAYLQALGGSPDPDAIVRSMSLHGQPILDAAAGAGPAPTQPIVRYPYPIFEVLEGEQVGVYVDITDPLEEATFRLEVLSEEQRELLEEIEGEWIAEGESIFGETRCWQCHTIAGHEFGRPGEIGPELTGIGTIQTLEYLLESIVNPDAVIIPPLEDHSVSGRSLMPSFAEALNLRQILMLAYFLKSLTEPPSTEAPGQVEEDPGADEGVDADAGIPADGSADGSVPASDGDPAADAGVPDTDGSSER